MNTDAALAYAERHALHACVVVVGDEIAVERVGHGWTTTQGHSLYSGTKSFWGVLALALMSDGLLDLDEPVGATLRSWFDDPRKRQATLRQLVQMSAGIGFGGLGNAVPTFEKAEQCELKHAPGTTFVYSGIPLQVFGAVLAQKFQRDPHELLFERLLDPIGVRVDDWRVLKDGRRPLPTGAVLSAQSWAAYGRFIATRGRTPSGEQIVPAEVILTCYDPAALNARYGLGWWLRPAPQFPELLYASGAGGQGLYILPSLDLVVAKFSDSNSFKHEAFLSRLVGS